MNLVKNRVVEGERNMKNKKLSVIIASMIIVTSLVGCSTVVSYKNENGLGLENATVKNGVNIYNVNQDKEGNKLNIIVSNPLNSKVKLTFGSTQEYDFILYNKEGKQIYKWSDDKAFGEMIVNKEIAAKGKLEYSIDLSDLKLKAGEYKYEFYLVANEMRNIPHKTGKLIKKDNSGIAYFPLKYEVKSTSGKELIVEVKNQTENPIKLTYTSGQKFDMKFYKDGKHVYTWSQDKNFIQMLSEKTLLQGESEIFNINLEELPLSKGVYDYEFYSVSKELSSVPTLKGKITIK